LIILDLNLPDFSGFEILKSLNDTYKIPIIIISGYNETNLKVKAFKYGASDYMVKPIDLEELEARIWVHLKRNSKIQIEQEINIFEIKNNSIFLNKKELDLTPTEFEILSKLIKNKNQTIPRDELSSSLSEKSSTRSLDYHIKNIRKKISSNSNTTIKTIYGVGYKLVT